jgi:ATP-dependent RNA helicase DDX41
VHERLGRSALVKPVTVNVGRAGAASLAVRQELEAVKAEARTVHLLQCLQKTPPPVLVFAERKQDVDAIHEYLLLKGTFHHTLINNAMDVSRTSWVWLHTST